MTNQADTAPVDAVVNRELCGCGRPVRYISATDPSKNSCNKYARCMTWDEQHELLDRQRSLIRKLANIVDTIDNGYCSMCGRHRVWEFVGDARRPGTCENPDCVSHDIKVMLCG